MHRAASQRSDGSTTTVTHRIIINDFEESQGVKTVEGQTYLGGDAGDEKRVVETISGVLFVTDEMHESLQMAADCLTQELYDAMETLFAYNGGSPKGPFKKKTNDDVFAGILYIGGVFVNKDQRGRGLGLEIVRALIQSLDECDLVLLSPAADPHPGPGAWNYAFDSLSAMFEKLGFQRCGGKNRRSGQSKFTGSRLGTTASEESKESQSPACESLTFACLKNWTTDLYH